MSKASMSDDLRKARALAGKLPSLNMIKLHREQCFMLEDKLRETLDRVEKEQGSRRYRVRCSKVFRELRLVAQRVKIFVDDCCYKGDKDFVLAAISVLAHKERFVKYYVELDWCMFLLGRCLNGEGSVEDGFEWERNVNKLVENSRSRVEKDLKHFRELLGQYVEKPGDHQKICMTLLRRFEDKRDAHHQLLPGHHVDDLGVPPVESVGHRIGYGGYGAVYELNWKRRVFAIKEPVLTQSLEHEVAILERCCHPNIVNLILFHRKPDGKQYLMMERLAMDLLEYIKKNFPFPLSEAVDMILQVCEGMRYLSDDKHVSHRDLKPSNILVNLGKNQEGLVLELQVADFGLAKVRAALERSSVNTPNVGTTWYRAPEMTVESQGEKRNIREESLKADMYSFAVTCSCILTGCEAYKDILDNGGMEGLKHFVKNGGRPTLPDDCPVELSSLLKQCWHAEPSQRPASFSEVCEKLRELKAKLLICGVDEGDEREPFNPEAQIERVTFNVGDRPLRILVVGDPNAVEAALRLISGAPGCIVEDQIDMRESRSASPPMCLYHNATNFGNDFTDIKNFVEARNKRWHLEKVKATWKEDLYYSKEIALFPNSSLRLHMVWFVCTKVAELPNSFQWDEITKKLCGLPVQMLVTEMNEYEKILQHRLRFFGEDQNLKLIMKVDLTDAAAKQRLWRACWEVKTRAEIENAAMIIREIRKKLGPDGILIPVGIASRKTKVFSVERSKQFVLSFLCTYWDIPQSFVDVLLERRRTQQETKFVLLCLQNAASILYRERELLHGLDPAEPSSEFLEREAQAFSESYVENLDLAAFEKMRYRDVRAFLQAVFEGKGVPYPLVSKPDQNMFFSKFIRLLRDKGPSEPR